MCMHFILGVTQTFCDEGPNQSINMSHALVSHAAWSLLDDYHLVIVWT